MDGRQKVFEDFEVPDPVRVKKALRIIAKHFPRPEGIAVLECGVTRGGVAEALSKQGAKCVGIDVNPRTLPGVEIIERDLNDGLPAFSQKFDVIFAGEVMEHIFDDTAFVEACYGALAPGGICIITVPNLHFIVNRVIGLFGAMPKFAYEPFHYHFYNRRTLIDLFSAGGFDVPELTSSHVLFSTRRNPLGKIFEVLGDLFPSLGAHLIICGQKPKNA